MTDVTVQPCWPPGAMAVSARYVTKEDRRSAIAALHAMVPAGACVFDMTDIEPRGFGGDPMVDSGFVGLKWEPV